jgi:hypothetical protein
MTDATVESMARMAGVSEKTVRDWIRVHGLPVTKGGGKGPGQGAIVDCTRFASWYRRHNGDREPHWSDGFAECYPDKNPFRDIAWNVCRDLVSLLGYSLRDWAENPTTDGSDYRPDGLTKEQARAAAYKAWMVATMTIFAYHDTRLDGRLRETTGADFDGWLSFMLQGDFHTPERPLEIEFPKEMDDLRKAGNKKQKAGAKRRR